MPPILLNRYLTEFSPGQEIRLKIEMVGGREGHPPLFDDTGCIKPPTQSAPAFRSRRRPLPRLLLAGLTWALFLLRRLRLLLLRLIAGLRLLLLSLIAML